MHVVVTPAGQPVAGDFVFGTTVAHPLIFKGWAMFAGLL
jgi:hypothetical protein